MKFVIVTGGVLSGLGKGITAASIGLLLKLRGIETTAIKIDPYINCDAGTMNPYQHGEVFVLDDGGETDLDLGHYERFLDCSLTSEHNITTGKVYREVIERERRGDYLGATVQVIPHITNEIKRRIRKVAKESGAEVTIVEVGGTVGDIESMPFLEALRQLHREVGGNENCVFVHTTLVPKISVVGEQKTKPTQHSVKELREIGISPDIIVGRCEEELLYDIKKKIALFCDVPIDAVISNPNVSTIYEVPLVFERQGLTNYLIKKMKLQPKNGDLSLWREFVERIKNPKYRVRIAIVGKYTYLHDSYISHKEALTHAGAKLRTGVDIVWVEAEDLEGGASIPDVHGIIVPGGFGKRGTEGKIMAIRYARENNVPFLGICLGFQLTVVEYARNVCGMEGANSTEFDENTPHPVVDLLPEQRDIKFMGATMRLGASDIVLDENSLVYKLYGKKVISERHRHRYEVNNEYVDVLERKGLRFVGRSKDRGLMEVLELPSNIFFVASQFHPEFKSRPFKPAPLYLGLVSAALKFKYGEDIIVNEVGNDGD
ncbi:MAG: CTP synthetase [Thermoplasmata archaeon]|nr:MAG: CTP synthetase [Thermoplasmata archaeon]